MQALAQGSRSTKARKVQFNTNTVAIRGCGCAAQDAEGVKGYAADPGPDLPHATSQSMFCLQAWSWQRQRVAELCAADCKDRRDTVFLLQV